MPQSYSGLSLANTVAFYHSTQSRSSSQSPAEETSGQHSRSTSHKQLHWDLGIYRMHCSAAFVMTFLGWLSDSGLGCSSPAGT